MRTSESRATINSPLGDVWESEATSYEVCGGQQKRPWSRDIEYSAQQGCRDAGKPLLNFSFNPVTKVRNLNIISKCKDDANRSFQGKRVSCAITTFRRPMDRHLFCGQIFVDVPWYFRGLSVWLSTAFSSNPGYSGITCKAVLLPKRPYDFLSRGVSCVAVANSQG